MRNKNDYRILIWWCYRNEVDVYTVVGGGGGVGGGVGGGDGGEFLKI